MKEYLGHPAFWVAVILVAVVTNWVWMRFFGGKGNLA